MSFNRSNKKTVSFRVGGENNDNMNFQRSKTKKVSILKGKTKKNEELQNEKTMEVIQNDRKIEEINNYPKKEEIKVEIPYKSSDDNKMKYLSTEEYFRSTIQTELEQGLLSIAMIHPANPIKFLGNYLIEKSKAKSSN